MFKKCAFILVLALSVQTGLYAQKISGFIRDMDTREAIPYATVQFGPANGTVANEEGGFSISLHEGAADSILVSSMGYEQKRIPMLADGQELIIYLNPSAIQLDEVLLSNRRPTAEEIIRKVKESYPENYTSTNQKYEVFYRGTSYMQFDDLDLTIDKASGISNEQVDRASARLDSLARSIMDSRLIEFRDYSGTVLMKEKDSSKIAIDKATRLLDSKKEFSMEAVQQKAQQIILQYLDTSMTYKLKTGLFKIEDSLSFDRDDFAVENEPEYSRGEVRSSILKTLGIAQWHDLSFLDKVLNLDAYKFILDGASYFQGTPIYVLSFFPRKGSSKYAGKLFVSARDFAVLKIDFAYGEGKRGQKFNMKLLLGIKYIENRNRGTVIFTSSENGKYRPYYISRESGNYIYLHRPFKFIENSDERDKVLFDFSLEGESREKQELLVLSDKRLLPSEFKGLEEAEKVPYTLLKQFEPSIWQDRQIIQPLEEMKNFKVED